MNDHNDRPDLELEQLTLLDDAAAGEAAPEVMMVSGGSDQVQRLGERVRGLEEELEYVVGMHEASTGVAHYLLTDAKILESILEKAGLMGQVYEAREANPYPSGLLKLTVIEERELCELREQVEALTAEKQRLLSDKVYALDSMEEQESRARVREGALEVEAREYGEAADLALREVAELREQVEALTAQLEAEERMVKRLRAVVLGAPRCRSRREGELYGAARRIIADMQAHCEDDCIVALVRLSPDGLELAGEVDNKEGADA
jgi:hypothetical protein